MASFGVLIRLVNVSKNLPRYFSCMYSLPSDISWHCGRFFKHSIMRNQAVISSALHTTRPQSDLMEFFDDKENWGAKSVKVGRPWKTDELRLKSNEDLHKLWYVLLKERNMIMTMEEEYKRQCELFPNPERLEKVEESMENLLEVVMERDVAYSELETGESCEPPRRWAYNELGVGYWRKCKPHIVPLHMSRYFRGTTALSGQWQHQYMRLRREKHLRQRRDKLRRLYAINKAYREKFPHSEIETDLSEFTSPIMSKLKQQTNE